MTRCENCNGEGLVGQGDKPWLQQGRLDTCGVCKGTGQLPDAEAAPEAVAEVPAEPVNTPESSTVDNVPLAPAPEASSDGSGASGAEAEGAPAAEVLT